jgi:hypothetical protein
MTTAMVFRTVATVCLLAGLLAGCGGASSPDDAPARKAAPAPDRTKVNKAEVAWAGAVIEWTVGFSIPVESAAAAFDEVKAARTLPKGAAAELRDVLLAILNCAPTYRSKVGEPPSERLRHAGDLLEAACQKFAVGADAALQVIDGEQENSRKIFLDQWKMTWTEARDLAKSAAQELVDFQPANTRELPVAEGATLETRVEPFFGEVASAVVGTEVEARCWSPADWARLMREMKDFTGGRLHPNTVGFTGFGDQRVNLAAEICGGLVALAYEKSRPTHGFERLKIAGGVSILMHEAHHANGVFNEALAECLGMQDIRAAAQRLGADEPYAGLLAAAYWEEVYPTLPAFYRSPECADGGRLDQHPDSSVWP